MTDAEKFVQEVQALPFLHDYTPNWSADFFADKYQVAVKVTCPTSHDSTEEWTFPDGSKAEVANPTEHSFRVRVQVL